MSVDPLRIKKLNHCVRIKALFRFEFIGLSHRAEINLIRQRQRTHKASLHDFSARSITPRLKGRMNNVLGEPRAQGLQGRR